MPTQITQKKTGCQEDRDIFLFSPGQGESNKCKLYHMVMDGMWIRGFLK